MTSVATPINVSPIAAWRHARGLSVDDLAEIAADGGPPSLIAMIRSEILAAEAGLELRPLGDRLCATLAAAGILDAQLAWIGRD